MPGSIIWLTVCSYRYLLRMGGKHGTVQERLERRVDLREDGCHVWTGAIVRGYGHIWHPDYGRNVTVHRAAYEIYVGPIPCGHQIHHLCDERACVNPEHLTPLSASDHSKETMAARWGRDRTHCSKGHLYSGKTKDGNNFCRECSRERERRYEARSKRRHSHS